MLRAGDIQLAGQQSGFRIDKKGSIDLVTEVDLACERMCRDTIAERFPGHDVLAEELGNAAAGGAPSQFRWVFDPLDGTTNYAHGLPIYCSSLALEIDGRAEVAAIYDPTRKELFTAERGEGSYLNGRALHVSSKVALIDSLPIPKFGPPKLAIRIVTLEESWEEAEQRMEVFLEAGAEAVWLVSEAAMCINVRTQNAQRIYERHETLEGGDLLPGFHLPLSEVFKDWSA